ncbi:g2391 [Coccomyxa viridis]|uniref:G2391 protein n=1 Tax=Coccomyxa viridis TaxID=1274662 RepID=A0ABP1FKB5_9CHLO
MFAELQRDYNRNLSWAKDFDPTTAAPPELSSWLYLFYAYLQLEEPYAEVAEWLKVVAYRLIDPPPPLRSFKEEALDLWMTCTRSFRKYGRPGSRASQHKRV